MQTIRQTFNWIISPIVLATFIVNFVFHGLIIFLLGVIASPFPKKFFIYRSIHRFIDWLSVAWYRCCYYILQITAWGKLTLEDEDHIDPNHWYLLIANHQSWMDILVIGCLLRNKVPPLRFFIKKELLWSLPIAGLCGYFMGFPLMSRHSKVQLKKNPALKGKDIAATKQACQQFKTAPTTIINFVEGTRITPAKHAAQQSPFKHLLKPKAGGIAMVIQQLHDTLDGIIDVTVHYDAPKISFLHLIFGQFNHITLSYKKRPITTDIVGDYFESREFRLQFQDWLNIVWEEKDKKLDESQ
jgi:1-acyl-sn-glycerol-3-phosphate acyltransferase